MIMVVLWGRDGGELYGLRYDMVLYIWRGHYIAPSATCSGQAQPC